jgi:hypothetical protein
VFAAAIDGQEYKVLEGRALSDEVELSKDISNDGTTTSIVTKISLSLELDNFSCVEDSFVCIEQQYVP